MTESITKAELTAILLNDGYDATQVIALLYSCFPPKFIPKVGQVVAVSDKGGYFDCFDKFECMTDSGRYFCDRHEWDNARALTAMEKGE